VTQTPQLASAWLLAYADIIGGIMGIIGSVILALPLVTEIADRKHWDQLSDFIRRHKATGPKTAEERHAEQSIRDHLLNSRLGRSQRHRKVTLFGLAILLVAFVFMTLAAVERRYEPGSSGTHASSIRSRSE
jgi:hypothetical protein